METFADLPTQRQGLLVGPHSENAEDRDVNTKKRNSERRHGVRKSGDPRNHKDASACVIHH